MPKSIFVHVSSKSFMQALRACIDTRLEVSPDWGFDPSPPHEDRDMCCMLEGALLVGTTAAGVKFAFRCGLEKDELLSTLDAKMLIREQLDQRGSEWRLTEVWSGEPEQEALPEEWKVTNMNGLPPWRRVLLQYCRMVDLAEPCPKPLEGRAG